ncbi:hypothetical protein B0G75_104252 [Paraburkholderia sp. BL18I3N2]|uniref:hypothetical protein n=1 Tax=Paraburkholderia sp. BL18I3N2 TaxID=1938799 RepID=UPI000D06F253|nr:hypothetical protein [Paraburkholderia sp. BL18I3N2]PRX32231.1 hypothetical protein B0G75_104252 [Paraburkholderia sp. BL18I3N2]
MSTRAPARSEQSKQQPINLSSLPREEAIERARVAGRQILADNDAVSTVAMDLWTGWMNANVPNACGQSEEEFGELVNSMMSDFLKGLTDGVKRFAADAHTLNRVGEFLSMESALAWKIRNVLAFMEAALDDDTQDSLPIRCTIADLSAEQGKLATNLMDLVWRASHA